MSAPVAAARSQPSMRFGSSARVRVAGVVGAIVLAGVGASAPAQATVSSDPVGEWDVLVQIHTDPATDAPLICDFYADQRLKCVSKPGLPELTGLGIWRKTGPTGFSFWLSHHAQRDAAGNEIGKIYTLHDGTVRGNRFSTEGTTFIALDDGSPWTGPIAVDSEAKRIKK